jgi:hypothetical protein
MVQTCFTVRCGFGGGFAAPKNTFCAALRALCARSAAQKVIVLEELRPSKPPNCHVETGKYVLFLICALLIGCWVAIGGYAPLWLLLLATGLLLLGLRALMLREPSI